MVIAYTNHEAALALINVVGESQWEAVCFAHGYLELINGRDLDTAARIMYDHGFSTLRESRTLLTHSRGEDFVCLLTRRERRGSAENPVTKLFPATITEQRFLERLDSLHSVRNSVRFSDDRERGHGLTDFTLHEGEHILPINIKNAGTRFQRAKN